MRLSAASESVEDGTDRWLRRSHQQQPHCCISGRRKRWTMQQPMSHVSARCVSHANTVCCMLPERLVRHHHVGAVEHASAAVGGHNRSFAATLHHTECTETPCASRNTRHATSTCRPPTCRPPTLPQATDATQHASSNRDGFCVCACAGVWVWMYFRVVGRGCGITLQAVAPGKCAYEPAAHGVHWCAPTDGAYEPAAHGVHCVAWPALIVPAAQGVHSPAPPRRCSAVKPADLGATVR
jgi:hypothetical protein